MSSSLFSPGTYFPGLPLYISWVIFNCLPFLLNLLFLSNYFSTTINTVFVLPSTHLQSFHLYTSSFIILTFLILFTVFMVSGFIRKHSNMQNFLVLITEPLYILDNISKVFYLLIKSFLITLLGMFVGWFYEYDLRIRKVIM